MAKFIKHNCGCVVCHTTTPKGVSKIVVEECGELVKIAEKHFSRMHESLREVTMSQDPFSEEVDRKVQLATDDVEEFESNVIKRHIKGKGFPCHWTGK